MRSHCKCPPWNVNCQLLEHIPVPGPEWTHKTHNSIEVLMAVTKWGRYHGGRSDSDPDTPPPTPTHPPLAGNLAPG